MVVVVAILRSPLLHPIAILGVTALAADFLRLFSVVAIAGWNESFRGSLEKCPKTRTHEIQPQVAACGARAQTLSDFTEDM